MMDKFKFIFVGLCLLLGTSSLSADSGLLKQLNPAVISYGKQTTVAVEVKEGVDNITLHPGGARLTGEFALPYRAQFLTVSDDYLFVITEQGELEVRDLESGKKRATLAQNKYQWVGMSHDVLLVISTNGDIATYDVFDGGQLALRAQYQGRARVQHAVIEGDQLYVTTDNAEVLRFDTTLTKQIKPHVIVTEQPVDRIAVNDNTLLVVTESGEIRSYLLSAQGAIYQGSYSVSLPVYDIKMGGTYAYVALGAGGVLILSLQSDGQLSWLGSHSRLGEVRQLQLDLAQDRLVLYNQEGEVIVVDVALPMMPTTVSVYDAKGSIYELAMHSHDVVIAQQRSVKKIDFSAMPPQLTNQRLDSGQGVNFGGERRLFIEDDLAYVADWFSGMHIYDVSDPGRIKLISSYSTPGSPKGVVVKAGYAYVADDDHGLHIVDVHNPQQPKYAAHILTPGLAYIPKIVGDHLYLASHRGGFQILDISAPLQPSIIADIDTPGMSWGIDVVDHKAYIADDAAGLLIYDVIDPSHPVLLGQFNPEGRAEDVRVRDHVAYVTFFDQGLMAIDVADAAKPELLAALATPGNARGIDLHENYAYIADWLAGVHVVDISDVNTLRLLGSYDTSGAAWGLAYNKEHLFVMDWWGGVVTIDVSNPQKLTLKDRYHERGVVEQVVGQGNYLYSANGTGGLQVFDNKNPLNPTWVTGVDLPGNSIGVAINDTRAYVISDAGLLTEIEISNPFQAHALRHIELAIKPKKIILDEHAVFIITAEQALLRVDVSGKKMNKVLWSGGAVNDIAGYAGQLYVALQQAEAGLMVLDSDLKPIKKYDLPVAANLIRIWSNQLVVYQNNQYLKSYRLTSRGLTLLDEIKLNESITDLSLLEGQLYVLASSGSLLQYSASELKLKVEYPLVGQLTRFWLGVDAVYLAGNTMITALKPLPEVNFIPDQGNKNLFKAIFPRFMPLGSYDLNISAAGIAYPYPNAIKMKMSFSNARIHCDNQSLCGDRD
ncbi:MAG: hypothetical protein GXP14_11665 [Gammaproteobacteria bacterium]|nr:hypothetical protein [Gammaproteobacteria bacterium]